MAAFEAVVRTPNASSYLRKLCQHWSHRFQVQYDQQHGTIQLDDTRCILNASPDVLAVRLELPDGADAARLQQVVEEHIRRFGFREELAAFPWTTAAE